MRFTKSGRDERGAALLEFTIGALVFLTATFAVLEFGRLLWTHNALTDAARRGARYAVNQSAGPGAGINGVTGTNVGPSLTAIRNVTIYGNPAGGTKPLVNNLKPNNVEVKYTNFALGEGTVTVSVVDFDFNFVVPIVGTTIRMPAYRTALSGENVGFIPANQ
jgi:Flp pilus assembly protein TadG